MRITNHRSTRKARPSACIVAFFGGAIAMYLCISVLPEVREEQPLSKSIVRGDAHPQTKPKNTPPPTQALALGIAEPDALDCKALLNDFRAGKVEEMNRVEGYEQSYVTRTNTDKPFYWATHKGELDKVRASSFVDGRYYEKELTKRITETFDAKNGKESIMIDVGGNIGWFSLVAAAHGATKVYTFEPNPANLVRICESLMLNDWWIRDDPSKNIGVLIAKGVSDSVGTLELYRADESNPGSYTFDKEIAINNAMPSGHEGDLTPEQRLKYMETAVVGKIDLVTLDSFAESHGWFESRPSIGFFKLDVEGFELKVIQGAKKLLESRLVELLAMEMKPEKAKGDKVMIVNAICNAGYDLHMDGGWMGPTKLVTKKYTECKEMVDDISNNTYRENLMFRLRQD